MKRAAFFLLVVVRCCLAAAESHFLVYDVYIDSGDAPLSAYQVKIVAQDLDTKIVGIEGGTGVFREPPYYDSKALQSGKIILAKFSLDKSGQLPKGRVRVASLHIQCRSRTPELTIQLQTAASKGRERIPAKAITTPRNSHE